MTNNLEQIHFHIDRILALCNYRSLDAQKGLESLRQARAELNDKDQVALLCRRGLKNLSAWKTDDAKELKRALRSLVTPKRRKPKTSKSKAMGEAKVDVGHVHELLRDLLPYFGRDFPDKSLGEDAVQKALRINAVDALRAAVIEVLYYYKHASGSATLVKYELRKIFGIRGHKKPKRRR